MAALGAATPMMGVAQESVALSSEGLWEVFTTDCGAVIETPDAAIAAAYVADNSTSARTSDGAIATISRGYPANEAILNALITTVNGGQIATCSITYIGDHPEARNGLTAVARAGAETLLGAPALSYGGTISAEGESADLYVWALDGFPPPRSVTVLNSGRFSVLTMTQIILPEDMPQ